MQRESHLTIGVEKALKKLDSRLPQVRADGAGELVQELVALGATKERIAAGFRVSVPTVHRWAAAKFSPRDSSKVKAALNSQGFLDRLLRPVDPRQVAKDAGIHSIDFFFEKAAHARKILKFKGFLEFQISDSKQVQQRMKHLLEHNDELKIYYVFPEGSRADETFRPFFELLVTLDEAWAKRIQECPVKDNEGLLELGMGYAGLAVIEYSDQGRKEFGRLVDVFLETPVRSYDQNGEPNPFLRKTLWIELPTEVAHSVWAKWNKFLSERKLVEPRLPLVSGSKSLLKPG